MMFQSLAATGPDALLEALGAFRNDTNPNKVDLGIGVYRDDSGQTGVLASVKHAEAWLTENQASKAYLSPLGDPVFTTAMERLVLGERHAALADRRVATIQTVGGSGALRVAGQLIQRANPGAEVWLPDPTWANHGALLGAAGLKVRTYPYYDRATHTVRAAEMLSALADARRGDVVVLHGCCHNPTGADLTPEQWTEIAALLARTGAVPLVDMAYQGFGQGLDADAAGLRALADVMPEMLVSVSCSKNFGLYRDRVGALSVIGATAERTATAQGHALGVVRAMYSMPPDHGAALTARILTTPELRTTWEAELNTMRTRIQSIRARFADLLGGGTSDRFAYLSRQNGMFSFVDVTPEQVERLRKEFHIYAVSTGRFNIAGLTSGNVAHVAGAIKQVIAA